MTKLDQIDMTQECYSCDKPGYIHRQCPNRAEGAVNFFYFYLILFSWIFSLFTFFFPFLRQVALAVLELRLSWKSACLCLPNAGIKVCVTTPSHYLHFKCFLISRSPLQKHPIHPLPLASMRVFLHTHTTIFPPWHSPTLGH